MLSCCRSTVIKLMLIAVRRYVDKYVATEISRLIISGRLGDNMDVLVDAPAQVSGAAPSSIGHFSFRITDKAML